MAAAAGRRRRPLRAGVPAQALLFTAVAATAVSAAGPGRRPGGAAGGQLVLELPRLEGHALVRREPVDAAGAGADDRGAAWLQSLSFGAARAAARDSQAPATGVLDYSLLHPGPCTTGFITSLDNAIGSVDVCASGCRANIVCMYFAYAEATKACSLFMDAGDGCPLDNRFPQYQTYKMARAAAPTPGLPSGAVSAARARPAPEINWTALAPTYVDQVNCSFSVAACAAAAAKVGLVLGSGTYNFSDNYSIKGCHTYVAGAFRGAAFYGLNDNGTELTSAAQLNNVTTGASRIPGFPNCTSVVRVARCRSFTNATDTGCDQGSGMWLKISDVSSVDLCRANCTMMVPINGSVCCYLSPSFGCWAKMGSTPSMTGSGRSVGCRYVAALKQW